MSIRIKRCASGYEPFLIGRSEGCMHNKELHVELKQCNIKNEL